MWVQMTCGGRPCNIEKARRDTIYYDGVFWRRGKNIKDTGSRKAVTLEDEMLMYLPLPPIPWEEWEEIPPESQPFLELYTSAKVNAYLKQIPVKPHMTSESIRDVFHNVLLEHTKDDCEEATKKPVHKLGSTALASAYAVPRKVALPTEGASSPTLGDPDDAPLVARLDGRKNRKRQRN